MCSGLAGAAGEQNGCTTDGEQCGTCCQAAESLTGARQGAGVAGTCNVVRCTTGDGSAAAAGVFGIALAALAGDDFEGVFEFLVVEFSGDGVLAEVSRRVVLADAFNAEDRVAVLVSLDGLLERADVLGVAGGACNVELDFGAGLEV